MTLALGAASLLAACSRGTVRATSPQPAVDTVAATRLRLAREVLQSIAGRENEPAGQVFKNVKRLNSVSASRLLAIMSTAYSKSLGVSCSHCHVVGEWESEAKPQKEIARQMAAMTATINAQLLSAISGLKGPNPVVNCTTCHRGSIKPALDIPP